MKYLLLPWFFCVLSSCVITERDSYPHLDDVGVEPLPADYSAGSSDSVDATTDDKAAYGDGESIAAWLTSFNSPELEQLVIAALNRNYDLGQQALEIRLAEQSVKITGASLLPTLNLSFNAQRNDNNLVQTNQFGLGLSASYEVDLWGRLNTSQKSAN